MKSSFITISVLVTIIMFVLIYGIYENSVRYQNKKSKLKGLNETIRIKNNNQSLKIQIISKANNTNISNGNTTETKIPKKDIENKTILSINKTEEGEINNTSLTQDKKPKDNNNNNNNNKTKNEINTNITVKEKTQNENPSESNVNNITNIIAINKTKSNEVKVHKPKNHYNIFFNQSLNLDHIWINKTNVNNIYNINNFYSEIFSKVKNSSKETKENSKETKNKNNAENDGKYDVINNKPHDPKNLTQNSNVYNYVIDLIDDNQRKFSDFNKFIINIINPVFNHDNRIHILNDMLMNSKNSSLQNHYFNNLEIKNNSQKVMDKFDIVIFNHSRMARKNKTCEDEIKGNQTRYISKLLNETFSDLKSELNSQLDNLKKNLRKLKY